MKQPVYCLTKVRVMQFALIDIETLSPQRRLRKEDVITGIGIKSQAERWVRIIKPSGGRNTDIDEANLIYEAVQHLKTIKPDVMTGCYLWTFDLPHLISRAEELDYNYNRSTRTDPYDRLTGKELRLELCQTLNTLRIIDLSMTDYVLKELVPKYGKTYLKVDEIYKELTGEDPKQFPEDLHVWVSAKAITGDPNPLKERLENDLTIEWAILQVLLSKGHIQI